MNRRELLTGAAAVAVAAAVPELPVEPQVEWFMLPRLAPAAVTVTINDATYTAAYSEWIAEEIRRDMIKLLSASSPPLTLDECASNYRHPMVEAITINIPLE